MEPYILRIGGAEYRYNMVVDVKHPAPVFPVKEQGGRYFILMGFAGFNSVANNTGGYKTARRALDAIRHYQGK